MLLEIRLDSTENVRNAERQPVEEQHGEAGVIFGESAAVRAVGTEDFVEPVEMIEVAGENTEDFQFEPAHLQHNRYKADREKYSREQPIYGAFIGARGE